MAVSTGAGVSLSVGQLTLCRDVDFLPFDTQFPQDRADVPFIPVPLRAVQVLHVRLAIRHPDHVLATLLEGC